MVRAYCRRRTLGAVCVIASCVASPYSFCHFRGLAAGRHNGSAHIAANQNPGRDLPLPLVVADDSGYICISVSSGISDAFGARKRSRFLPLRLSTAVQWIDMYICRVCDGTRTDDTDIPLQTQIVQCHTRINRLK